MSKSIVVEDLSKIYRLGEISTGTISRDMERWFKTRVLNQEDPFLKIGETNDRTSKGASDIVYSLRDINFEIERGDAVGIIGRNGAGKSTLLKILSRVTTPTTGRINIKGRVASLLEVGTGFHPELTGRENIYLNGAILGMRKREIDRKLDEIIDFSGVERYIDTPVKRYSSGMYVRLAFAVAAHLESEILIVDEVLAVGDAEFQKKCLGKMGEVSKGEGRTVLFVSHNMGSIQSFCSTSFLLSDGMCKAIGNSNEIIKLYRDSDGIIKSSTKSIEQNEKLACQILSIGLLNKNNEEVNRFDVFEEKYLEVKLIIRRDSTICQIGYVLNNKEGILLASAENDFDVGSLEPREKGIYVYRVKLPNYLKAGNYFFSEIAIGNANVGNFHVINDVISFEIVEDSFDSSLLSFAQRRSGSIISFEKWHYSKLNV